MRPDPRQRPKNVKSGPEAIAAEKRNDVRRAHLAEVRAAEEAKRKGEPFVEPSAAALAERTRNDAALHLLDELETAVRAGDDATAKAITAAAAALGYAIRAVRVRNGCARGIDFGGGVDEARAGALTAAALERRAKHEAAKHAARAVAVPEGAGAAPRPRAQYVAVGKAIDGGKARA